MIGLDRGWTHLLVPESLPERERPSTDQRRRCMTGQLISDRTQECSANGADTARSRDDKIGLQVLRFFQQLRPRRAKEDRSLAVKARSP